MLLIFLKNLKNKKYLLLCLLATQYIYMYAQKGLELESTFQYGHIFKQNTKIIFPSPKTTNGLELDIRYQTYGKKDWHAFQHYPALGCAFIYYNLGDDQVLGKAFGFVPHVKLPLYRSRLLQLYAQFGFGIGYITKHFDQVENPTNNAVGSAVNNCSNFQLRSEWRLLPKFKAIVGGSFTHFSNGASQLPNLGINIPAIQLGVQYSPTPVPDDARLPSSTSKAATRRWALNTHFDMAYRESMVARGPRYPIYIASLGGMYHWNKINRLTFGAEYEQHTDVRDFGLFLGEFKTKSEAQFHSSRVMAFVGNEFLFGDWSFTIQTGAYIANKNWYLNGYKLYNKIGMRYYLPPIGKPATRFYVGLYMKAHRIVAEYIALGAGATF